uniref:Uncharacterized protein n=1 Tax=Neospora caninum (strain Liverpool) TaxID=572307 RepID=A0A0F7UEY3_NEOCL|nr:TPA: hypothetical protein BN1204_041865 [Neospora caninum Liverpool]
MGNACHFCRNGRRPESPGKELGTPEETGSYTSPQGAPHGSPSRHASSRSKELRKELSFRRAGTGFSNETDGGGEVSDGSKRYSSPSLRSCKTLAPQEEDQLRSFYERNLVEQERHVSFILNEEAKLRRGETYSRVPSLHAREGSETLVPVDPHEVNEAMERFDVFSPDERHSRVEEILEKYVESQVESGNTQSLRSFGGRASPGSSILP